MENLPITFTIIRGPNFKVEIDESIFWKMKYHMGRSVDGQWFVGRFERTPKIKCFLIIVENRTSDTLKNIMSQFVNP